MQSGLPDKIQNMGHSGSKIKNKYCLSEIQISLGIQCFITKSGNSNGIKEFEV